MKWWHVSASRCLSPRARLWNRPPFPYNWRYLDLSILRWVLYATLGQSTRHSLWEREGLQLSHWHHSLHTFLSTFPYAPTMSLLSPSPSAQVSPCLWRFYGIFPVVSWRFPASQKALLTSIPSRNEGVIDS